MTISSSTSRLSSASAAGSQKETTAPLTPNKSNVLSSKSALVIETTAKQVLANTPSARPAQSKDLSPPGRLDGKLQDAAGRVGVLLNQAEGLAGTSDPGKLADEFGQAGLGAAPNLPSHTFDVDLPSDANVNPRRDFQSGLADGQSEVDSDEVDSNGQHESRSITTENSDNSTDTDVTTHDSDKDGNATETQTVEHTNSDGTKYGESTSTTTRSDGSSETTHTSWGNAPGESSSSSASREPREAKEPSTSSTSGSNTSSSSNTSGNHTSSTSGGNSGPNGSAAGRGVNPLPDPVGLESNGRVTAPYTPPSRTTLFGTVKPNDIKSNPRPDDEPRSSEPITRPGTQGVTMPPDEFGGAHTAMKPLLGRNFGKIDPTPDQRQNAAALDPSGTAASGLRP